MLGFLDPKIEMFATISKNDPDMYDIVFVNMNTKKFLISIEEYDYQIEAYDIENNVWKKAVYLNREIFDILISELENRKFKRKKFNY